MTDILPPGALGEEVPPPPPKPEPEPEIEPEIETVDEAEDEAENEAEDSDETENDNGDPVELPEPTPPPKRTRKKPVARRSLSSNAPPPEQPLADAEMHDYDTWTQRWDWGRPNMKMKIKRLSPSVYKGKAIAGFIIGSERENDPWTLEQIAHTFGGGGYMVQVTGIDRKGKNRMLSSKQIKIAGDPRITRDTAPAGFFEDDDDELFEDFGHPGQPGRGPLRRPLQMPGRPLTGYTPPPMVSPTAGMVPEDDSRALEMIDDQFKWMRDNMSATNRAPVPDTGRQMETTLRTLDTLKTGLEAAADRREAASTDLLMAKDRIVEEHKEIADRKIQDAQSHVAAAQTEKTRIVEEAQARVDAAHVENRELRDNLDKLRTDAQIERERISKEAQAEKERIQRELSSQATEQRSTDQSMMAMLLGNQQSNAAQQIDSTMKMFEARLSSAESAHSNTVANLQSSYENRLTAQSTLYQSQFESLKQTYTARESQVDREQNSLKDAFRSREKQLERELNNAREESQQLRRQVEEVRNTLMVEIQRSSKTNDPSEQLTRMGGMLETLTHFKDMVSPAAATPGIGGGEGDVGDGIDNPAVKTIMQLGNKIVGVIPNITDAIAARAAAQAQQVMAPPPGYPPQMMQGPPPQQMRRRPPQQMPPQQMPPQQRPQPAPGPQPAQQLPPPQQSKPKKKKKPGKKIAREQLDLAVMFINGALDQSIPPDPTNFAKAAQGQIDNDVLRELARRPPERVVHELMSKGILIGTSATERGHAFIVEMLTALKPLVLATARPRSLPDPVEAPEVVEAPTVEVPEVSEAVKEEATVPPTKLPED